MRGNKSESSQSGNLESTLKDLARESGYDAAVKRAWFLASGAQAQPSYSDVLRLEALVSELSKNAPAPDKAAESRIAAQVERAAVPTVHVENSTQGVTLEEVAGNEDITDEATVVEDAESQANDEPTAATSGNWSGPAMTGAAPLLGIAPVSAVRGNSFPVLSRASSLTPSPPTPASSAPTTPPAYVSSEHGDPYSGPYRWHVLANTVSGTVHEEFVVTIPSGEGDCPCDPSATLTPDCGSVTFVERTGQCPTFTFHYDWNTCGCDYGDHNALFVATNCGAEVKRETRTETVDNRPEWSTPPTGITGGTITAPTDGSGWCISSEVSCSISNASDQDSRYDICGSPQWTYPYDTLTYTWSATGGSWKNGVNTGQNVTWIAPSTPGSVTITCTINDLAQIPQGETGNRDDASVQRNVTVKVIGGPITASTTELRYYCGGYVPDRYKSTLTAAAGQPAGTSYLWNVYGPGEIESGQGTAEVVLKASHESGPGGIWVILTYSLGSVSCDSNTLYFTGAKPYFFIFVEYVDSSSPYGEGYETQARYLVRDNLWRQMGDICVWESFDQDRYDYYVPNNWPTVQATGLCGTGPIVTDYMGYWGSLSPQPLEPPQQNSYAIYDHTQHHWVGGTTDSGCQMKVNSQTFNIDKGRHE